MSVIHVRQIKNHLYKNYEGKIELKDVKSGDERQSHFLSRALAAYSIQYIAGIDTDVASQSITDGSEDNGLDAIYYDERKKVLYISQSKWMHEGSGEPSNGDVKKFIAGLKDLFNLSFERFNKKIKLKKDIIKQAMWDSATKYEVILTYTGVNELSGPSSRDFEDFLAEMNDTSPVVHFTVFNQRPLYLSLTAGLTGEPIDLMIVLKSWGLIQEPYKAYYGQINGVDVSSWWDKYRNRLFARNLRDVLGDTDVNEEIEKTLSKSPSSFWYFNNGITIVCKDIEKNMVGGNDRDFGNFHCKDISIVNGAQTVGTIGKFGEKHKDELEEVFVPIRIISLSGANGLFGESITKANNRQNKIENRDFVSLDPEQMRIKTELAIDGINYNIMRSESVIKNEISFDLIESTTAMSCASTNVSVVVQLKREIGKLWEDISKASYKTLFNSSVSGLYLWRCVQIQRKIDKYIEVLAKGLGVNRDYSIVIHGNRLISLLVFNELNPKDFNDVNIDFQTVIEDEHINELVNKYFGLLKMKVDAHYGNSVLPTLFKNVTKCIDLVNKIKGKQIVRKRISKIK